MGACKRIITIENFLQLNLVVSKVGTPSVLKLTLRLPRYSVVVELCAASSRVSCPVRYVLNFVVPGLNPKRCVIGGQVIVADAHIGCCNVVCQDELLVLERIDGVDSISTLDQSCRNSSSIGWIDKVAIQLCRQPPRQEDKGNNRRYPSDCRWERSLVPV